MLMGPATATLSTAMGCRTAEMALTSSTAVSEAKIVLQIFDSIETGLFLARYG